jgi:hypothetical protein
LTGSNQKLLLFTDKKYVLQHVAMITKIVATYIQNFDHCTFYQKFRAKIVDILDKIWHKKQENAVIFFKMNQSPHFSLYIAGFPSIFDNFS